MNSKIAFIFPGQGSQSVGMGKDLYKNSQTAKEIFQKIDTIFGEPISSICFNGPDTELTKTIYTQPAILSVSIVLLEMMKEKIELKPDFVAGHSLGEYTALYAAEAISLEAVVELVKKRASLMTQAQNGAMSAVIGLDHATITNVLKTIQNGIVSVANFNTYEQTIISGDPSAVQAAHDKLTEAGAKRVLPLNVGGAFHSPLMQEASTSFSHFINNYNLQDSKIPVITNVDGSITYKENEFKTKLPLQISQSVQWVKTIETMMQNNVKTYIEIGPGKVLSGLIKKIDKEATVYNMYDVPSFNNITSELSTIQNRKRETYV